MESTGAKLSKARQARGYSLEEAGLQTRIRPTQIAALEADDYSSFASNTYARGFLMIYGRFLGVDISAAASQLDSNAPISVEEYQYLNAYPENDPPRNSRSRSRSDYAKKERKRPSLAPLIVFFLMLAAAGAGLYVFIQTGRLNSAVPTPGPGAPAVSEGTDLEAAPGISQAAPPNARPTPAPPVSDADRRFLTASPTPPPFVPQATPVPAPVPPPVQATPVPISELIIEPLKKTWVRIRRDDPAAKPDFDDIVYPKVGPLRLKGLRFWVEVNEPDAIIVRRNGQLVACQPPGVVIQ